MRLACHRARAGADFIKLNLFVMCKMPFTSVICLSYQDVETLKNL